VLTESQLHGQTGQTGQDYRRPELPATTTSTSPATNTVAAVRFITKRLEETQLHDQTPSTTPAADAALSTTELLEQILSHFEIKELVLLRRVSRHWSDVMAESPVLQRAMFLAPEPELPVKWHKKRLASDKLRYTKEVLGTVFEFDSSIEAYKSSRFNPIFFETRLDAGMDETNCPSDSVRLYPRRNLKDVSASNLFSRMLIAQPPVKFAYLGCRTQLSNRQGIRVSDAARIMEYEDEYSCDVGHVFSLLVPCVMFPTRDEEKEGQIMRRYTSLGKHCTDRSHQRSRLVAVTTDGRHLIV
jgi:hypothetical protein